MHPSISVVMPTFNQERYLPQAIESVLAQTHTDFELIISDDHSSDGSLEIIRTYASCDTRIRWLQQPHNLGMVPNWNAALRRARAPLVQFVLGDDCLAHESALEHLSAHLAQHPRAALAASARLIIDEHSAVRGVWDELGRAGPQPGREVIGRCLGERRNLIGEPSAVMFRRALALRGFDPDLRQIVDEELWFHLLLHGDLVYDPRPLCAFRTHPLQQTARNRLLGIGPLETLHLTARYVPRLGDRASPWSRARIIFRAWLTSRKHNPRLRTVLAAEDELQRLLTKPVLACCWIEHRLRRPVENLERALRRARSGPPSRGGAGWRPLAWTPHPRTYPHVLSD